MSSAWKRYSWRRLWLPSVLLVAGVGCGSGRLQPVLSSQWAEMTVRATGRAAINRDMSAAQARVTAERAAIVNGYERLAEQVYGVALASTTTVRDVALKRDDIQTALDAFVKGARVLGVRTREELGIVEVDMELLLGKRFEEIVFR